MCEKCPCCGSQLIENNTCMTCNRNLKWLRDIAKKSEKAYTLGYQYAKTRNLSMSKAMLLRAVAFNKHNIQARNLLGLVLFELGDIGEALKHWIVSQSIKKEDNLAVTYIKKVQNEPEKLENYKEALVLYNKSLRYLAQDNGDIAVIGLKKAANLLPNFVEAKNLLAACYIHQNQLEKALEQVKQVLQIDIENTRALTYLKEISSIEISETKPSNQRLHIKASSLSEKNNKPQKIINRGHMLRNAVAYFVVGAVCMFAVQVGLILPTKTQTLEADRNTILQAKQDLETKIKNMSEENNNKLLALEEENKKLKNENNQMQASQNKILQKERIQTALQLQSERKWIECAEIIYNISATDLDEENKNLYESMKEEVFRRAADTLYQQGYSAYQNNNTQEAKAAFEKVLLYGPGLRSAGDAMYYMGQMEEQSGNKEKAKQYYSTVLKDYEGSNSAYRAKRAIEQLEIGA